jgi:hypothetical protein
MFVVQFGYVYGFVSVRTGQDRQFDLFAVNLQQCFLGWNILEFATHRVPIVPKNDRFGKGSSR